MNKDYFDFLSSGCLNRNYCDGNDQKKETKQVEEIKQV